MNKNHQRVFDLLSGECTKTDLEEAARIIDDSYPQTIYKADTIELYFEDEPFPVLIIKRNLWDRIWEENE